MKPIFIFTSLAFLLSACNQEKTTTAPAAAPAATAAKPYPLDVCIVSDEKLGEMGEPVVIVHQGQEIKFCCDKCQPKFEKDPAKYLSKLESPKP
jgi:hypothetical protein